MRSTVRDFLRAQFGLTQPADELPADGGMASSDWDAAQRPSTPTDWSQPVQPQPDYQLADGRTAPQTPGGNGEPVQTVPNPQPPVAADPGQWLAEDSVSAAPEPFSPYGAPRSVAADINPSAPPSPAPLRGQPTPYGQVASEPGEPDYAPQPPRTPYSTARTPDEARRYAAAGYATPQEIEQRAALDRNAAEPRRQADLWPAAQRQQRDRELSERIDALVEQAQAAISAAPDETTARQIRDGYLASVRALEAQANVEQADSAQQEMIRQSEIAESATRRGQAYTSADRAWDSPAIAAARRAYSALNDYYEGWVRNPVARPVTDILGEGQLGREAAGDEAEARRIFEQYGRDPAQWPPAVRERIEAINRRTNAIYEQGGRYASERAPGTEGVRAATDIALGVASVPLMPGYGQVARVARAGTAGERAAIAARTAAGIGIDPTGAVIQGGIEGVPAAVRGARAAGRALEGAGDARLPQGQTSLGSGLAPTMSDLRNAAQGGVIGAASEMTSDEELTPEQRLARIAAGAALGVGAGRRASRQGAQAGRRLGSGMVPEGPRTPRPLTAAEGNLVAEYLGARYEELAPAGIGQRFANMAPDAVRQQLNDWRAQGVFGEVDPRFFDQQVDEALAYAQREVQGRQMDPSIEAAGYGRRYEGMDADASGLASSINNSRYGQAGVNPLDPSAPPPPDIPRTVDDAPRTNFNLNSAGGAAIGAGGGGLTGDEEGEFDPQRALIGAAIGAVAGPKAGKNAAARNAAMVQAWNRGPRKAPGSSLPWRTRLAGALTDDLAPFAQMEREAERRLGRQLTDDEKISVLARVNPDGMASQRLQQNVAPAIREVVDAGGNLDDLNLGLMLTHNIDVAKEMARRAYDEAIDAGRTPAQAAEAAKRAANDRKFFGGTGLAEMVEQLETLQQKILSEGGEKAAAAYDSAAQRIWQHQGATLENLVDQGVISREAADDLAQRYPHYIKTYVLDFDNPAASIPNAGGRGISLRQNLVKPLTTQGSDREVLSPLESIVRRTIEAERAGHKNELFNAFMRLIDEDDTLRQSVTASRTVGTKEVTGMVNGERVTMRIARPLADVLERPGQGPHIPILSNVLNWWKGAITSRNPGFSLLVSPMRDAADFAARQSAVEGGPQAIGRVTKAYAEQLRQAFGDIFSGRALQGQMTGDAQRFMEMGGFSGRLRTDERGIHQIAREIAQQGGVRASNQAVQDVMKDLVTFGWTEKLGNRLEQVPRAAAMRLAEQRGADPITAMMAGRDATIDFQRAGWLVRYANAIVPFLNPTVQSTAQLGRLLRDHPKAAVATIGSLVAGPSIAAEAYNRADEQRAQAYEDVPQYVKDSGIVVMMPWSGSDNRGERPNYLWFPLGVFAPFATLARESAGAAMSQAGMGAEPTRSAGELLTSMLTAYSPVKGDSAASVLSSVVPPGLSTGIELGVDKDFFRNRRIATDRADEQASALSHGISGALNWMGRAGRGLPGTGGLEEVRPSQVEYAIKSDTGVYGQTAIGASNLLAGNPRDENRPIQNAPGVGAIAGRIVRDQGGERFNQLTQPDAMIPEPALRILDEAGVKRSEIKPVASTWQGASLTRGEQERWQHRTNRLVTQYLRDARSSTDWSETGKRETLVQQAISKAKSAAAQEIFTFNPKDRIERDERRKRARAS